MVRTNKGLTVLCIVLAATIFIIDSSLPLGVAGGMPYVAVILISLWSPHRTFTLYMALLCSLLVVAGYFTSPMGGEHWKVLSNRFLAEMVIWITAILGIGRKSAEVMLKAAHDNLEERVEERTSDLMAEIAGRKRVEAALRKSEKRFRTLVDTLPHGVQESDISGNITFSNRAHCMMHGYGEGGLQGRALTDFLDTEEEREGLKQYLKRLVVEQPVPTPYIANYRTKDGRAIDVEVDWNYKRDENGMLTGFIAIITDITERKKVEAALEEQLYFFQTLIDSMPSPIFYKDTGGRYLGCNAAFEESIGMSKHEIEGRTAYDLATKELADKYFEMDKKLFDNPGIQAYETKVKYADGKEHDILFNKATFTSADGGMAGLVGVMTDITGHMRTEYELDLSKRMLVTVLDTIPVRVFWKDVNLKYMGCNTAFAKDAGLESPDEIIGKDDFGLAWVKEAQKYRAYDSMVIETGEENLNYEEFRGRPAGEGLWLKTSKVPLRNAGGDIIGILGIYEDITEHKKAEEQIRKLSHAVEQSFECVVITDTDGTIEYVNPYFTELTGYTFDEAVGQNSRILKSGEQSEFFYKELWDTIKSGKVWRGQFLNKKKNGELYWEYASISPIRDETGRLTHFIAVKEDITERKRAEEELKEKSEKLDLLNKDLHELTMEITRTEETEKRRFAELLHDDIGQNLVAVKMALSNTLKHASDFKPDIRERLGDANAILESTIGSIRVLSSDLYPVTPYVEGLIDKKGLIEAVRWHEKNILCPSGIQTDIKIDPAVEEFEDEYKRQIYRVFQESFQNIMKHASATEVSVFCGFESGLLLLSVKDNGKGLANRDMKPKKTGGVGLRLMRERVKSMGGTLVIDSVKSGGTEIRAEFNGYWSKPHERGSGREE